ncbi:MAG: nucleotidyltransferase domain-containing protein [Chloroflexi bacterium]|nr:nucleotidyltransferase domain-containing protein [Chloroflexota bacterium]
MRQSKDAIPTFGDSSLLESLLDALLAACRQYYAARLVSLVIFGSVGRGTPRPDSDVDILIIADDLPVGRLSRVNEFRSVEDTLKPILADLYSAGRHVELSPVFKTREELAQGSPLLLDMIQDARVLYDRAGFFITTLAQFQARLEKLHARRIWRGNAWLWDLKPDYRVGEVFEL